MTLLGQIIEQSADHTVPLPTILRKCLIFASKLEQSELKTWVLRELEGFPTGSHDELPPHRIFGITAKGFFIGPLGAQINDQPLPSSVLDQRLRWWATTSYAMQGVAAYEAMVAEDPLAKPLYIGPRTSWSDTKTNFTKATL